MESTVSTTPIVCAHCRTINYRETELTCKRCGQYFSFKRPAFNLKKRLGSETLVNAVVMSGVAIVCGTAAAAFTFMIASTVTF
jgi:uncharacterized paraquat-inducible protein A